MEFSRPSGYRFVFAGMNLRTQSDALPPDKYSAAVNVRSIGQQSVQTRPGYTAQFTAAAAQPITDIRAYAALGTDNNPRFLVRDSQNHLILDNGVTNATLAGTTGSGVSMIPFRPGASPQAWMYCAGLGDYQKLSAPDSNNLVTAQKVGIAEPQIQLEAAPQDPQIIYSTGLAASWTPSAGAGALSDANLLTDTATAIFVDPVLSTRYSVQVVSTVSYVVGQLLTFAKSGGGTFVVAVQEVLPAVSTANITIAAIRYASGSTGACVIVPTQMPAGQSDPADDSLSALRRGALVRLNSAETVLVLSVTHGPAGTICFECSTSGTFSTGQSIAGIPAVLVDNIDNTVVGQAITSPVINGTITYGTYSNGNFATALTPPANFFENVFVNGAIPQLDDYFHVLVNIGDVTKIVSVKIVFNVGTVVDFVTAVYSYTVTGAALLANGQTGITVIAFPVSALVPSLGTQINSLAGCNGIAIIVNVSATVSFQFGSVWLGGAGQLDIGTDGVAYQYRIVPRSTLTGAKGNPSPVMRYGVRPRRQNVKVPLPTVAAALPASDAQVDVWDVYRFGGTVTSYRYIGSGAPNTNFIDQFSDGAATAGNPVEVDNFEPWPTVGLPFSVTSSVATIAVTGNQIVISAYVGAWPTEIPRWLPGTLITIGGLTTYTLRARPTSLSGTSYLFPIEENGGASSAAASFAVAEPVVGRQPVPYMWGPDAYGVTWAVGDALRPGTVYFSKAFAPDSAPEKNTVELCPPSEPLLGGSILNGVSLVSSTKRWWAMYPSFGNPASPYSQIEQNVGRGLVAPYGQCSDGAAIYFWAKDCIAVHSGGPFKSLTDEDLYPLFPHEGVSAANIVRNGATFYAPDYSRAATFRLARVGVYLFADYQDSTGTPRTLVLDLRSGGWSADAYADAIRVHYAPEQQEGTLLTNTAVYPLLVMADSAGNVWKETRLSNDNATGIACLLGTFEFNGGDERAQPQWGDLYLDCLAASAVSATPVSLGAAVTSATVIAANAARQFTPVSLGGRAQLKFLGLQLSWTDNFASQSTASKLYVWQPSLVKQPEIAQDRIGDWVGSLMGA